VTLLLFPWVGIAPPYHFTENLSGLADWILPGLLVASGTLLNVSLTKKGPLILGWLGGFAGQAVLRNLLFDTPLIAALLPMTGVAFLLFTFYMITDPGTTPFKTRNQITFGVAVAVLYGFLVTVHVVFGLFFALTIVSTVRGLCLYAHAFAERRVRSKAEVPASAMIGRAGS
jgi:enediyne biosynthesis protein E5